MRALFVCLGNICRSPTAEAVARQMRPDLSFDSAGTANWHRGKPPYGPMQAAASAQGYDMRDLRARQVTAADFETFDHIIAMDADNLAALRDMSTGRAQLSRLLDHAPETDVADVPDPYYTRDFDAALRLIETGVSGLLRQL